MHEAEFFNAIKPDKLKEWIRNALSEAGVNTISLLKDDRKIELIAVSIYKKMPLMPYRAFAKVILGESGFTRVVFKIRDQMIQANSLDLSCINIDYLKAVVSDISQHIKRS